MRNLKLKLSFVCVFVLLAGTAYAEGPRGSALRPEGGGSGDKGGVGVLDAGPNCPPDTLFGQEVAGPDEWSIAYWSDAGGPWLVYENFWDVDGPICDIHWWGLNVSDCVRAAPDTFEIKFYLDAAGSPGAEVCSYTVTPQKTGTGNYLY